MSPPSSIEGVPVLLKAAYLLVAEQEGIDELQWECLAYALDTAPIAAGPLRGRHHHPRRPPLRRPAVLVRSVDGAHVLRGDGDLAGVAVADLA